MPQKYDIEIYRTVTVTATPNKKSLGGWGWIIAAVLVFGGIGAIANKHPAPSRVCTGNRCNEGPPPLVPSDDIREATAKPAEKEKVAQRLVVPGDSYHQCYVDISATGKKTASFRSLIDTGAWTISFSRDAARALGFDPAKLVYDQETSTANGIGKAAKIRLAELRIGTLVLKDFPAQVDYRGLDEPLLGATVLKKFARLEYSNGNCTLTFPDTGTAAARMPTYSPPPRPDGYKRGERSEIDQLIKNTRSATPRGLAVGSGTGGLY
jgi:clan AA aspartic protease (TIGR02281 family)